MLTRPEGDIESDDSWFLLDFQKGEPRHYIRHVQRGVELAAQDPDDALLIFSGGQSRYEAGPKSEASSYLEIANIRGWWGSPHVAENAITEEFARDSFENLLFSICRFKQHTGSYPETVTLVSWEFKRQRFHLHCDAIGFPLARFRYDGPNNPDALEQALEAERAAIRNYSADPYSASEMYRRKREDRNPFGRVHDYAASNPGLLSLLSHKGPEKFAGPWPW